MTVFYAYCSTCGMEWTTKIFMKILGHFANGVFLQCPTCNGSIGPGNYDVDENYNGENDND